MALRVFQIQSVVFQSLLILVATLSGYSIEGRAQTQEKLSLVPAPRVCMVTNMVFPRDQIPVVHNGKTYYGCCENCKKTLSEDSASRVAIDPFSNKPVDKAQAVIASREDGSVLYFENQENFKKFSKKKPAQKSKEKEISL